MGLRRELAERLWVELSLYRDGVFKALIAKGICRLKAVVLVPLFDRHEFILLMLAEGHQTVEFLLHGEEGAHRLQLGGCGCCGFTL